MALSAVALFQTLTPGLPLGFPEPQFPYADPQGNPDVAALAHKLFDGLADQFVGTNVIVPGFASTQLYADMHTVARGMAMMAPGKQARADQALLKGFFELTGLERAYTLSRNLPYQTQEVSPQDIQTQDLVFGGIRLSTREDGGKRQWLPTSQLSPSFVCGDVAVSDGAVNYFGNLTANQLLALHAAKAIHIDQRLREGILQVMVAEGHGGQTLNGFVEHDLHAMHVDHSASVGSQFRVTSLTGLTVQGEAAWKEIQVQEARGDVNDIFEAQAQAMQEAAVQAGGLNFRGALLVGPGGNIPGRILQKHAEGMGEVLITGTTAAKARMAAAVLYVTAFREKAASGEVAYKSNGQATMPLGRVLVVNDSVDLAHTPGRLEATIREVRGSNRAFFLQSSYNNTPGQKSLVMGGAMLAGMRMLESGVIDGTFEVSSPTAPGVELVRNEVGAVLRAGPLSKANLKRKTVLPGTLNMTVLHDARGHPHIFANNLIPTQGAEYALMMGLQEAALREKVGNYGGAKAIGRVRGFATIGDNLGGFKAAMAYSQVVGRPCPSPHTTGDYAAVVWGRTVQEYMINQLPHNTKRGVINTQAVADGGATSKAFALGAQLFWAGLMDATIGRVGIRPKVRHDPPSGGPKDRYTFLYRTLGINPRTLTGKVDPALVVLSAMRLKPDHPWTALAREMEMVSDVLIATDHTSEQGPILNAVLASRLQVRRGELPEDLTQVITPKLLRDSTTFGVLRATLGANIARNELEIRRLREADKAWGKEASRGK